MVMEHETENYAADLRFHMGAGDGNRTRTISLGITPIGAVVLGDLQRSLSVIDRR
jgi:hypothetical protein